MKFVAPLILAASILAATACSNATPAPAPTNTPMPTYTLPPTYTPEAEHRATARKAEKTAGRFYDCLQNNPELFETLKSEIAGSFTQEDTGLPDDFATQFIEAIIADRELFIWSFSELDPASPELRITKALMDTDLCRP